MKHSTPCGVWLLDQLSVSSSQTGCSVEKELGDLLAKVKFFAENFASEQDAAEAHIDSGDHRHGALGVRR